MRLIDADALIKTIGSHCYPVRQENNSIEPGMTCMGILQAIQEQPTIEERKTGKWIKLDMHAHLADHKCTACGQECYVPTCMGEPMYTYCPNCGAKMEAET